MTETILRRLIDQQLTEYLNTFSGDSRNTDKQPTERDFALWLTVNAGPSFLSELRAARLTT